MAERFNVRTLTIDNVVIEAISKGTPHGLEARKICEAETRRHAEELAKSAEAAAAASEVVEGEKKADGLSVAAVAAHAAQGAPHPPAQGGASKCDGTFSDLLFHLILIV